MDVFISKVKNLADFVQKDADKIVMDEQFLIKNLNIERLYDTGKDTEGKIIGTYKPVTVERRRAEGLPVPGDKHWMSFWKGQFFQGIELEKKSLNEFTIKSTYAGFEHMEEENKNYLGLDEKQAEYLSNIVADDIVNDLVKYFA